MIIISVDDRTVLDALAQIVLRIEDPATLMRDIGETLAESTIRRFETHTGPDGQQWEKNSQVTILQYLGVTGGNFGKNGRMTKKGAQRAGTKSPLIGETKSLSSTITYQLDGPRTVLIGTPVVYGEVQQFGAKQGAFGRDRRNHPLPWGDIPARPYLGLDEEDQRSILDMLSQYLKAP